MNAETPPDVALVTGFPRLLARRVVREVLADAGAEVLMLVRPSRVEAAQAFVRALPEGERARVSLLEGDVTAIDMGLSGAEFLALGERVTCIHHAAQTTHEGTEKKRVEALNVGGTREVIELARASRRLRRLVAYSSTLVAGDHRGTLREDDLELSQGFHSPVEESFYRAEKALRRHWGEIPVTVVRPSIMVGDSKTGEIDLFDGPYLFVLLLLGSPLEITLPLPSRGDLALNLVPVDYVARAAVALGRDPTAASRTFHLVDPAPLPSRRVFELVAQAAGKKLPRGFIPVNLTRALLRTPGLERFAKSPRAFLERLATESRLMSQSAREHLAPLGIECPPFDAYVDPLVGYVRERLAERSVRHHPSEQDDVDDPLA